MPDLPAIAITMGDPAGIGPEIVLKVLLQEETRRTCRPILVADRGVMEQTCVELGIALNWKSLDDKASSPNHIDLVEPEGMRLGRVEKGKMLPELSAAAMRCLEVAFALAQQGKVQRVVSAPLCKEGFRLGGYNYRDELVYLEEITSSTDTYILGIMRGIWTVAVAEHVAFRDILTLIKQEHILLHIERLHHVMCRSGFLHPRIAVSALNVHGGEGGLIGKEEIEEIEPAIKAARAKGILASGPYPADTVFARALAGQFDGVVAMHHDQVNIARKLQPMAERATIFMGLPVPCCTTAHGTAFDIAGKGIADPGSLQAALRYAIALAS